MVRTTRRRVQFAAAATGIVALAVTAMPSLASAEGEHGGHDEPTTTEAPGTTAAPTTVAPSTTAAPTTTVVTPPVEPTTSTTKPVTPTSKPGTPTEIPVVHLNPGGTLKQSGNGCLIKGKPGVVGIAWIAYVGTDFDYDNGVDLPVQTEADSKGNWSVTNVIPSATKDGVYGAIPVCLGTAADDAIVFWDQSTLVVVGTSVTVVPPTKLPAKGDLPTIKPNKKAVKANPNYTG